MFIETMFILVSTSVAFVLMSVVLHNSVPNLNASHRFDRDVIESTLFTVSPSAVYNGVA